MDYLYFFKFPYNNSQKGDMIKPFGNLSVKNIAIYKLI